MILNHPKLYLFKNNSGKSFIYSGYTGFILEDSPRIQNHLENIEFDEEVDKYLLGESGEDTFLESLLPTKPFVDTILFFVTNQCNLACSYCYERVNNVHNSKKLDIKTFKTTVLYFIENFVHQNVINIGFFGGEPLLNFPLIKESIKVLKEISSTRNIIFHYCITTNGTLLNDEIIDFLTSHNFNIGISIDGTETLHDLHRKFLDGRGSYRTIIGNVAKLAKYCNITAQITITDYKIDLIELYQELENNGFSAIKTECVVSPKFKNSSDDLQRFSENLQLFADYFISNLRKKRIIKYIDLLGVLKNLHFGSSRFLPCNTGFNKYSVATDGSIYFCQRFMDLPEFKWGNAMKELDLKKRDQFLKRHIVTMRGLGRCKDCWAQRVCGGTCYHASYVETGITERISELYCGFRKVIYEKALYIYSSLQNEEKNFLG